MLQKTTQQNPSLWLICLLVVMLVVIILFTLLPPVLTPASGDSGAEDKESKTGGLNADIKKDKNEGGEDGVKTSHNTVASDDGGESLVHTQYGDIRGVVTSHVRTFHGVPYAMPPIGPRRWKAPQKVEPWRPLEYDATWIRPGCPQSCEKNFYCPANISEDCLFLEVYTPRNATETSQLPVMFYIHGGSFKDMSCTSPVFNATKFVERSGVVVVFVEYRLGVLGFLVTGSSEEDATGNYGVLDQRAALYWVTENIHSFGGSPDKITIAGQSAGSQSLLIHLMSPETSRHFRYVIIESPPVSINYKTLKEATERGQKFASVIHCTNHDVNMTCLRQQSYQDILKNQKASKIVSKLNYLDKVEPWGPVVDGKVVRLEPLKAFEDPDIISKKPIIWGITTEEAVLFVRNVLPEPSSWFMFNIIKEFLFKKGRPKELDTLYPSNHTDSREDISFLFTDFLFRCPRRLSVERLIKAGFKDIWLYKWAHAIEAKIEGDFSVCSGRVCHGVELPFVFKTFESVNINASERDLRLSDDIVDYYAKFIRTGNPNGGDSIVNTNVYDNGKNPARDPRRSEKWKERRRSFKRIYWPRADEGVAKFSQLVFKESDDLKVTDSAPDERCKMWNSRGYALR